MNHSDGVSCIDCHMPFAAKSGTTRGGSGYKADVRSHLMTIKADTASMFTSDGSAVKDDEERSAALSPHFACLSCHNNASDDGIPDKTIAEAASSAEGMHTETAIHAGDMNIPVEFALLQNYPNPFNPRTQIEFHLPVKSQVKLDVYNISGQIVATLINTSMNAGIHNIYFNASRFPSGVYIYKIATDKFTEVKKMTLLK